MSKRSLPRILGIAFSGLIVLTQFQNCAPVTPSEVYSATDPYADEVRIVDDWSNKKVQLPPEAEATGEGQFTVMGFCDRHHSGELVEWEMVKSDADEFALQEGVAECERGGVRLVIPDLKDLDCDVAVKVYAYFQEDEAVMELKRRCDIAAN